MIQEWFIPYSEITFPKLEVRCGTMQRMPPDVAEKWKADRLQIGRREAMRASALLHDGRALGADGSGGRMPGEEKGGTKMNGTQTREGRREVRAIRTEFQAREENSEPHISGYFAVFDGVYEIAPGMTESVAPEAFNNTLGGDIRALTNHDTTLVLGRTKNHTLQLSVDAHGLFGDIRINPNDVDAMNLYERVRRGDVDQCSFGFDILSEETDFRDDGSVHFTIREVKLYEVSVVTFPAYEETLVSARMKDVAEIKKRKKGRRTA